MTRKPVVNIAASVKQRLLNIAKESGENYNFLLDRYAAERFLYRLSCSRYANDFVLKGAMLFHLRSEHLAHRSTRDLDLLGFGTPDIPRLQTVFKEISSVVVPDDGIVFGKQIQGERIKNEDEYLGARLTIEGQMGSAKISLQIDIGFGDAVVPKPIAMQLRTLLESPALSMLVYPWEAVIAEKFHAIVELGMDNSRMKDYFDLYHLAKTETFDGTILSQAIRASFERRQTPIPDKTPVGLMPSFGSDAIKLKQWIAFVQKQDLDRGNESLDKILHDIKSFLMPVITAIHQNRPFAKTWSWSEQWR